MPYRDNDQNFRSVPGIFTTLLILVFINGMRVGGQLVISAWLAVKFTGDADAVGILFVSASLTALIFARPIGNAVGAARSKKRAVLLGQGCMTIVALSPIFLTSITGTSFFVILVVVNALMTTLSQISGGGADYFIRRLAPDARFHQKIALLMAIGQVSMAIGTTLAGVALFIMDFTSLFFVLATLSFASFLLCRWRLPEESSLPAEMAKSRSFIGSPFSFTHLGVSPLLLLSMLCTALAFAVGQFTNVLLPGFVQLQRSGSSLEYSTMEIAWSIGALLTSSLFVMWRTSSSGSLFVDCVVLCVLAVLLALVPSATEFVALTAIHFLLGIGYAAVRVRGEARFLILCRREFLAQARATTNMLMQGAALLVFSFPIAARQLDLPTLYQCASALIGVATLWLASAVFKRMR